MKNLEHPTKKFIHFINYFVLSLIMLFLGYFLAHTIYTHKGPDHEQVLRQLETEIRHELQQKKPIVFYISESLQITKKADGSGVIRVIENRAKQEK